MNTVIRLLAKTGILQSDIDYHLIRASMVLIFLSFGYQKWFEYEAQVLIPYISNGPLIFWLYPAFGVRGASWFLGVSEWLFGALLFLGFWDKRLGNLARSGRPSRSWPRSPSFPSCRMDGILLPGFLQWPETFLSS
jgi:uncharacterized membrane protein YkgB